MPQKDEQVHVGYLQLKPHEDIINIFHLNDKGPFYASSVN